MNYFIHIMIILEIYIMLSMSLNLLVGYTGLLSLCNAAFFGIGAYATTIILQKFQVNFFTALSLSIIITGIISFLVSFLSLRFRGDFFIFFTLGFQVIIYSILNNWIAFTRGPYGIYGIPRPEIFGIKIISIFDYLIFYTIFFLIFMIMMISIFKSPFGLSLKALRDNEIAAENIGKPALKYFLVAFTIAGASVAIPGGLYATYITFIDPSSFSLNESIFQFTIILLGGCGNIKGPIVGAIFMVLFPEMLRFIGLPEILAPNLRQIIYGIVLILLIFFRPQGMAGDYKIK